MVHSHFDSCNSLNLTTYCILKENIIKKVIAKVGQSAVYKSKAELLWKGNKVVVGIRSVTLGDGTSSCRNIRRTRCFRELHDQT